MLFPSRSAARTTGIAVAASIAAAILIVNAPRWADRVREVGLRAAGALGLLVIVVQVAWVLWSGIRAVASAITGAPEPGPKGRSPH